MERKGATKHCCWGTCKSDSRYPDKLPEGTVFIRFAKPGNIKDSMTEWEKRQQIEKSTKAKRWQHACGRRDFDRLDQITKDTYICSLHFVERTGPTVDNPDPFAARLSEVEIAKRRVKRKAPKSRSLLTTVPKVKKARTSTESECHHVSETISAMEDEQETASGTSCIDINPLGNDKATQTI